MKNHSGEIANEPGATIPNGAAAAAILATGAGCFLVSAFAWLGDAFPVVARFFNFYNPTGPLSGVTTSAIIIWLVVWIILSKVWGGRFVPMGIISIIAFLLLGLGFFLSFPPLGNFLQGR